MSFAAPRTLAFARDNAPWLGAGFLLAFGSSFGQTFFLSLFGAEYRSEFGLSDGQWGAIYMVATLFSGAALIFLGPLADRYKARDIALFAGLVFAALCLLIAAAPGWELLALAVMGLRFCGQGMFSHLSQTCMARWFSANRGRALALAAFGYPVGEALLPFLAVALAFSIGWRGVWLVAAGLLALVILPALWRLLKSERRPSAQTDAEQHPGRAGRHWSRSEMLRHWTFFALAPAIAAPSFILTAVFFQIAALAEARDWSLALATATYPIYSVASIAAALGAGLLIDRFSARALLPYYLLPMAAGVCLFSFSGPWVLIGVMAMIGLTAGAAAAVSSAVMAELYGTRYIGAIKSLGHALMVGSTALGPGVTGALIDAGVPLSTQFLGMALYALLVSAALFALRNRMAS